MAKIKSGGGLTSNKVVHSKGGKVEPRSRAVNPGGADQLGQAMANRRSMPPLEAGPGYKEPKGPTSLMVNGPKGQGRELHPCGSQGFHGTAVAGVAETSPDPKSTSGPRGRSLG
jgi:hypothetical protein